MTTPPGAAERPNHPSRRGLATPTNTIEHQLLLRRYNAVHGAIMAGEDAWLQAIIDDGSVWAMDGRIGRAGMDAINARACLAPPEPQTDFYRAPIPAWWMLEDQVGSPGSVANAEAKLRDTASGDPPGVVGALGPARDRG